jgi:branched-chain amino acid transport system ATP-binding protein
VSAADAPLLEIRDLAVHFGGIKAVDGVSMSLREGRIFGILGPNGSGKSTLLAAITQLVPVLRGDIIFAGRAIGSLSPADIAKLGVARSFQTARLLPDLTVRENIELGADAGRDLPGLPLSRARRRLIADRVNGAMERTGLTAVRQLRPGELAYGMQRRVEIARAISRSPRLLLLDEPIAGMNRAERAEISELLAKLRDEGLTQLLVEHDVQTMVDTCDYLYGMESGVLIAQGSPREVVRNLAVQESYLGRKRRTDA